MVGCGVGEDAARSEVVLVAEVPESAAVAEVAPVSVPAAAASAGAQTVPAVVEEDRLAPLITIRSPSAEAASDPMVMVVVDVTDSGGLASFSLRLDGVAQPIYASGVETASARYSAQFGPLSDGLHVIDVTSVDVSGNQAAAVRAFTVDGTAPSIVVNGCMTADDRLSPTDDLSCSVADLVAGTHAVYAYPATLDAEESAPWIDLRVDPSAVDVRLRVPAYGIDAPLSAHPASDATHRLRLSTQVFGDQLLEQPPGAPLHLEIRAKDAIGNVRVVPLQVRVERMAAPLTLEVAPTGANPIAAYAFTYGNLGVLFDDDGPPIEVGAQVLRNASTRPVEVSLDELHQSLRLQRVLFRELKPLESTERASGCAHGTIEYVSGSLFFPNVCLDAEEQRFAHFEQQVNAVVLLSGSNGAVQYVEPNVIRLAPNEALRWSVAMRPSGWTQFVTALPGLAHRGSPHWFNAGGLEPAPDAHQYDAEAFALRRLVSPNASLVGLFTGPQSSHFVSVNGVRHRATLLVAEHHVSVVSDVATRVSVRTPGSAVWTRGLPAARDTDAPPLRVQTTYTTTQERPGQPWCQRPCAEPYALSLDRW